jgi:hypothetical protein
MCGRRSRLDEIYQWGAGEVQALARAFRGHSTITGFEVGDNVPFESLDAFYSALATLPAMESITLGSPEVIQADESALSYPKSLTELLRVPSLRSVCFYHFYFTRALCQATASALVEGTAITSLEFIECSFSAGECAVMMTNGLSRNTSVTCIDVSGPCDETLHNALATALPSNSTLRDLLFQYCSEISAEQLSPVLLALSKNAGLKTLKLVGIYSMNESLCTAMQNGLGMNETLGNLELSDVPMCDDNADLWCRAISFLRTNKALKSLIIRLHHVME